MSSFSATFFHLFDRELFSFDESELKKSEGKSLLALCVESTRRRELGGTHRVESWLSSCLWFVVTHSSSRGAKISEGVQSKPTQEPCHVSSSRSILFLLHCFVSACCFVQQSHELLFNKVVVNVCVVELFVCHHIHFQW